MKRISVIGAGTMGAGIAHAFAMGGWQVVLTDQSKPQVEKGRHIIEESLREAVRKENVSKRQAQEIKQRILFTEDTALCKDSELVIEAVYEDMKVKRDVLRTLEKLLPHSAIIATNTSSLSVTEMGNILKYKERFLGLHFFNPASAMKLVEVVSGVFTDEQAIELCMRVVREIGKIPICVREGPGFVVNRLLIPMINEAIGVYAEGIASAEDIDTAMKFGANHPIGPLKLADMIGLDIVLAIMQTMQQETGEEKYRPHVLLRKMVRGGILGRKTKKGFYIYDKL